MLLYYCFRVAHHLHVDGFTTKMPNAALKHRHHGLNVCVCVCVFCSLFLRVINTFNLLFHGFYSVFFIHGGDNDKDGSNTFKNASSCGCCCWKGNQLIKSTHTDALMSKYILQNAAIQVNRLGIVNSNSPNDDR